MIYKIIKPLKKIMHKNTKIILGAILAIAVILTAGLLWFQAGEKNAWVCENGQWQKIGEPKELLPPGRCGDEDKISNFEMCSLAGYPVMESYPRQCKTPGGETFSENIGNELEKTDLIKIDSPRPNQEISSPLIISGQARGTWFFEASFPVRLFGPSGNLLVVVPAQAKGDWMTEEFVPFEAKLDFVSPGSGKGLLVLEKDNPSGLAENADQLIVPVVFAQSAEKTSVNVFFGNNVLDPEVSCDKVFPTSREVSKTQAPARAALEELLKGPLPSEAESGFFSSINSNVKIQSLTIENGVAKADFDEQLQFQIGGSCRVIAIRTQIIQTLKQFPTVNEVIISINGQTEDILQP